jgi:hypothetical protein
MYFVITTILAEICVASNLKRHFSHQDGCVVLGFLTSWVDNIANIQSLSVLIWAIILVLKHLKCPQYSRIQLSLQKKIIIDFSYLLCVILLPLLIIGVPLKEGKYGNAIVWCWIKINCSVSIDLLGTFAGFGIYGVVGVAGVMAVIGITVAYCQLPANFVHVKPLLLQSFILGSFVLLLFVVTTTSLVVRTIYSTRRNAEGYPIWLFYGTVISLSHMIIPVGFFGSFYFKHFQKFYKERYRPRPQVEEDRNGTAPESERKTFRSSTYFSSVSYTNGFTNIGDSETTPLVTCTT